MSERKTPGTTLWVAPSTRDIVNKMKKKGETVDQFLRRRFK
jgi:hypothetical protein